MFEANGWLLDVFTGQEHGVVFWLLGEDGQRYRLTAPFPVTFYAAGPLFRLRELWRYLQAQPFPLALGRVERRDLFSPQPLPLLSVEVANPVDQPVLFRQVSEAFPDLSYFDADIPLSLRAAARYGVFPLAYCHFIVGEGDALQDLQPLSTPWDLDPPELPLRILWLEPDCDPAHDQPRRLKLHCERSSYALDLDKPRPLLVNLRAILNRHDPDLLLSVWGDGWLLPHLLELAEAWDLPLPLNREAGRAVEHHAENTYFSYGQVIYRTRQVYLFGRWHIDIQNAMLYGDYGLDGVFELARVTALPVQTAARVSPGSGISAMQMLKALRLNILVPWHKQQVEEPKTALELLGTDQGGMVYQPVTGLHRDVAGIDFISMYPSIMVRFNISPETVLGDLAGGDWTDDDLPVRSLKGSSAQLSAFGEAAQGPGLIPQTLSPLLEKRLALKTRLANLPAWHPARQADKARASAHKWLLVTCFGYLGYKNARFGRIEAHEAVTAYGREALLRAKEAAEEMGFTVLHLYVDGLWVRKDGLSAPADFQPLLDEIVSRTGLPIALDGVYRWVAFLPSRQDDRVPVPNRYFGIFQDGSMKVRGIENRRRDTPAWIADVQTQVLELLAEAADDRQLQIRLVQSIQLLRRSLAALRAGQVTIEKLLVRQKLSRNLEEYRTPSPVARAAAQLEATGKSLRPGQWVRFLYVRGGNGVHAWDLPDRPNPAAIDVGRYSELFLRAAATVLQPFGYEEARVRQLVLERPQPLSFFDSRSFSRRGEHFQRIDRSARHADLEMQARAG